MSSNTSKLQTRLKNSFKHYAFYPLFPFLSVAFFILVASRRFTKIQFATSDNGRIGGILNLYWYLSDIENNLKERNLIVCFYPETGKAANSQWDKMLKAKVAHFNGPIVFHYLQRLVKIYKIGSQLLYKLPGNVFHNARIINSVQKQKAPMLALTKDEIEYGEKLLEERGIKKGQKIFCFHNRDSAYLNNLNPNNNWKYHDYRDSSIFNYIKAADHFSKDGKYTPVRVGSIVLEKLPPSNHIVDYANSNWQSEFMDIYLAYRSSFFLCSDTGISVPPEVFHKPMVYVNWTLLSRMTNWVHFAVFIPKKIFSKKFNRLLTFKEIISNSYFYSPDKNLSWDDFELIENTSDEILDACLEMENRMNGTWIETEESKTLQTKFWSLYPSEYIRPARLYMGTSFLKNNSNLLDS